MDSHNVLACADVFKIRSKKIKLSLTLDESNSDDDFDYFPKRIKPKPAFIECDSDGDLELSTETEPSFHKYNCSGDYEIVDSESELFDINDAPHTVSYQGIMSSTYDSVVRHFYEFSTSSLGEYYNILCQKGIKTHDIQVTTTNP